LGDFTSQVIHAINGWLQSLADGVLQPALHDAGLLMFQTPALDQLAEVRRIAETVRGVANSFFILALLGCAALIMTSSTFETGYTAKRMLPRLALGAVMSNASLSICGLLTTLDNAMVVGLLGPDPAQNTWAQLTSGITTGNLSGLVIFIILALAAAAMAVFLIVIYVARDLLLVVLTVSAPLALATYGLPQTDELAHLWWRAYVVTLFLQVGHAILIAIGAGFAVHSQWLGTPGSALISALMLITLLFLMVKLPVVAYRIALRSVTPRNAWMRLVDALGQRGQSAGYPPSVQRRPYSPRDPHAATETSSAELS